MDTKTLHLPPRTKCIYLVFVHDTQRSYSARPRSRMCARFTFPEGLTEVHLSTLGREGLLNKTFGLRELGTKEGYTSESLRGYHQDLLRRGLYNKRFDAFYP